jgi:hypothetical protein
MASAMLSTHKTMNALCIKCFVVQKTGGVMANNGNGEEEGKQLNEQEPQKVSFTVSNVSRFYVCVCDLLSATEGRLKFKFFMLIFLYFRFSSHILISSHTIHLN